MNNHPAARRLPPAQSLRSPLAVAAWLGAALAASVASAQTTSAVPGFFNF